MEPRTFFVRDDGDVRTGWRIAFFLLATVVGGTAVWSILYSLLALTPVVQVARDLNVALDQVGTMVALLVGTYAAMRIVDGASMHPWRAVGLGRDALRWRCVVSGLAAGVLAIGIPALVLLLTGFFRVERQPAVVSWAQAARAALFVLAPSAVVEELAVRGYLFTVLRDGIRTPGAIALTSAAFALMHVKNPGATVLTTVVVAMAGVFLATLRVATASLYAAIVAHLSWNLVQVSLLHAPVSGLALPTPGYRLVDSGPSWLTGGDWGPEGGAAAAAGMLITTFILVWRPRKRAERHGQGEPEPSVPSSVES